MDKFDQIDTAIDTDNNTLLEEKLRVSYDMDLTTSSTPVVISLTMDINMKVEPMESMDNGHDKLLP